VWSCCSWSPALYGCALFSYLYLWTVAPWTWPRPAQLPGLAYPFAEALLLGASSLAVGLANRRLSAGPRRIGAPLFTGLLFLIAALAVEIWAQRDFAPTASAYGAVVWLLASLAGFQALVVVTLALFTLARAARGKLDRVRRVTFDNARLFWHYTVGQSLVGVAVAHGFPRMLG